MKKWVAALSVTVLFLTACQMEGSEEEGETDTAEEIDEEDVVTDVEDNNNEENIADDENYELSQNLEQWLPKLENVVLEYQGGGFEGDGFTRTPQFVLEDTYQFVTSSTATTVANIYEYREDSVVSIFSRMETYFRENFMDTGYPSETDEESILLQLPIEVGNTWEGIDGTFSEITDSHIPIETENAGTFEAIEVTRTSEEGESVLKSYYAEGIGLVRSESNTENTDEDTEHLTVSTLSSIHGEEPEYITTTIYTLDSAETGLEEHEAGIYLNTNDPARMAIAEALKGNHEAIEGSPVINDSVEINYMYLDENDVANVDFSEELLTEMQYDSSTESLVLQAITNTVGAFYRHPVEEVMITVEEEPYMSEHMTYEEEQTIEIDESMVEE